MSVEADARAPRDGGAPDPACSSWRVLVSPTAGAMATLALLVALPYAVPGLDRLRLLHARPGGDRPPPAAAVSGVAPAAPVGEARLVFETTEQAAPVEGARGGGGAGSSPKHARAAAPEVPGPSGSSPRPLEDPSGGALDPFYRALARVERKERGAIARISFFGDSVVASDFVTSTLRRRLQARFGDAGHGFMLLASAWPGYHHQDVVRLAPPGWNVSRVVGPFARDGLYGYGGVSFRAPAPGVWARFATAREGRFGRAVSRFVIDYLEHPEGPEMELRVDGRTHATVSTRADTPRSQIHVVEVPDGPHELEIVARGAGLRAFGVWMERDEPGVVVDAIGIQGCRIRFLDQIDDAHWAEQLKLRAPHLLAFMYGMNESEDGTLFPLEQYESTMRAVLQQVRRALPDASCLLVGPMDRADRRGDVYTSRPVIPKFVAIQRKVAADVGCAFWDTFAAMGGVGSMGIWVQRGLGGADLAHPSSAGAELLGRWIEQALLDGYARYLVDGREGGEDGAGDRPPPEAPPPPGATP